MSVASEIREGLENLADAVRTLAGSMASIAAAQHSENHADQVRKGASIYREAEERFADTLTKLTAVQREDMARFIEGICKGPGK